MKRVAVLPNMLTLANAGLGLLAISKSIDALALGPDHLQFGPTLEQACWFIFLAGIFDALDGKIARLTDSFSDFGAQLDSFADAITFGVAPAMLAKVMLESEGLYHPRLNFIAAASYSLLAVLRLARFNLDNEHGEEHHRTFSGLPSPAAAGLMIATILMTLSLGRGIEGTGVEATAVGRGLSVIPEDWRNAMAAFLTPALAFLLPGLGLLMVSRVRYAHGFGLLLRSRGGFGLLVRLVFVCLLLYVAPVPVLFATAWLYVGYGLWREGRLALKDRSGDGPSSREAA